MSSRLTQVTGNGRGGGGTEVEMVDHIMSSLKDVKKWLSNKKDKNTEFIDPVENYKYQRTREFIAKVKELTSEHEKIMLDYEITIDLNVAQPDTDHDIARKKLNREESGRAEKEKGMQRVGQKRKSGCRIEDAADPIPRGVYAQVSTFSEKVKERNSGDSQRFLNLVNLCNQEIIARSGCRIEDAAHPSLQGVYAKVRTFWEKVKERNYGNSRTFLKLVNLYDRGIIERSQLFSSVGDLFQNHSDLMDGFKEFFSLCETTESMWRQEAGLPKQVNTKEKNKETERDGSLAGHKVPIHNQEKYFPKSISELDLSNCESCTPSYRLLPSNYPIPKVSQRTRLEDEVLNDSWVSVASGNGDYSSKHMRVNQYGDTFSILEDERFELDMLFHSLNETINQVEDLLNIIKYDTMRSKRPIRIENHFKAIHFICIERTYGDRAMDVKDVLRKDAPKALPLILSHLKLKRTEWAMSSMHLKKVWAEIYAKNYQNSLDYRSLYFKRRDEKSLSTKALLSEIKAISEKHREVDMLVSVVAGYRRPISPKFVYEYSDPYIHEDLYQLIKFSCRNICTTKEQFTKAIRIWTSFLELIRGVPPRSQGAEYGVKKDKNNRVRNSVPLPDQTAKYRIFYGNDSFYVLFRLHQVLYQRMLSAKLNSSSSERKLAVVKDTSRANLYARFISSLQSLLNGFKDKPQFEEDCRAIFGTQSYILFTIDKLIFKLVKQLQELASKEMGTKLFQLYEHEKSKKPGKFVDLFYHASADALIREENIYRFTCSSSPSQTRLSIQMKSRHEYTVNSNVAAYLHNDFLLVSDTKPVEKVFLQRNKRKIAPEDDIMEGVQLVNGLNSTRWKNTPKSKAFYIEQEFFLRRRKRRCLRGSGSSAHN